MQADSLPVGLPGKMWDWSSEFRRAVEGGGGDQKMSHSRGLEGAVWCSWNPSHGREKDFHFHLPRMCPWMLRTQKPRRDCLSLTSPSLFKPARVPTGWARTFMEITEIHRGTSVVAPWKRVCLPKQETWGRSLIRVAPTCLGATTPECQNYWTSIPELRSHNYWAHMTTTEAWKPRACTPQQGKPLQWEACALQLESRPHPPRLERASTEMSTQQIQK